MDTLLITGVSGMLGWTLAACAAERFRVVGTYREHGVELPGEHATIAVDINDADSLRDGLEFARPAAVVHLAAMTDPNACQRWPKLSKRVNMNASICLAEMCWRRGIPLVYASTDLVFCGDDGPYAEEDRTSPINVYGVHKVAAERGIRVVHRRSAVCRLPLMFGEASAASLASPGVGGTFLQGWVAKLRAGETLKLFTDEYRTPASARDVSRGLLLAVEALLSGEKAMTLHLGGPERVSRYEFGQMMCAAYGLNATLIEPCLQRDVQMAAPRALDVSLTSERAREMGYDPKPIMDELRAIRV